MIGDCELLFDTVIKSIDARIEASEIHINDMITNNRYNEALDELRILHGVSTAREWVLSQREDIMLSCVRR